MDKTYQGLPDETGPALIRKHVWAAQGSSGEAGAGPVPARRVDPGPAAQEAPLHAAGDNYHLRMPLHHGVADPFQCLFILHQFKPLF